MKTNLVLNVLSLSILCLTSCSKPVNNCEHSFKFVGAKSATCLEEGMKTHYECVKCGSYFSAGTREPVKRNELTTPALGHTFTDSKVLLEQTCKADGVMLQKCIRCDVTQEVSIPKYNDHVFNKKVRDDKYLKQAGDCLTKDIYYYSCGCGESSYNHTGETFEGYERHTLVKHEAKEPQGSILGNSEYYTCSLCEKIFTLTEDGIYREESEIPEYQGNIKLNRLKGAILDIVDKTVENYLKVVDDPATESNEIAEFVYNNSYRMTNSTTNKEVTLSWTTTKDTKAPYTLTLYKDEAMTKEIDSYVTDKTSVTFRNMIPGTYYYQVTDSAANKNYSIVDSFSFNSHVRAIDTRNQLKNMRDLGGWKCEGGTVKYGKLFRSANWEGIAAYGDEILTDLGIKTELDVRFNGTNNYDQSAHPREDINFLHIGVTDSYPNMLTQQATIDNLFSIFYTLSNDSYLPLVYHCSAGSDRTGLVSFLVEGLLGVSNEDILHDYELTSWYYSKRLRGDVYYRDGLYGFESSGACDHGTWVSNIMYVVNGLLGGYGDGTGSLSYSVRKFLKNKVGLTDQILDKVKANLIEAE